MYVRSSKRVPILLSASAHTQTHYRSHSTHSAAASSLALAVSARPPSLYNAARPARRQRAQGRASPRRLLFEIRAEAGLDRSDSGEVPRGLEATTADKLRFLGFLVDPVVGADKSREAW
ncbi:hypothetical protein SEVIR_5G410601v4 [Setaria viridis]